MSFSFHDSIQKYATTLLHSRIIDQDTIHHLFPGLLKLLDFQRRFLISMEQIAEIPWKDQAWGKLFTDNVRTDIIPYLALTSDGNVRDVAIWRSSSPCSLYLFSTFRRTNSRCMNPIAPITQMLLKSFWLKNKI